MRSISGEENRQGDGHDEKIFVCVRVRPMNEKEITKNDSSDWECINDNTIIYRNGITERSMYPSAYTFDRVYGCDNTTRQVYEEGIKRVALSALNGINSSIFAYGQTSSGKTYTMTGITQYAISDIFDYIDKQDDREFVSKFSAIEIYNECVRDLLSAHGTPLRLLDDPEKGTVVDRLTEIRLTDWTHLMELLAVCEAQRKIGETSLNEMSSRSHQIIRLTIESSACEFSRIDSASTLTATVNFVDLAGSERASQTLSAGTRLKEGCHINRSLLTLGTVIRKLSKGRNCHIPYRDSKLTRILQNSLGGNARTAIVCTLSPAHTHLEQSRNTLLFAVCAKEVRTSAQVNVVMSEKALVKQLQREMARLENELKSMSEANNSEAIIEEKELEIQMMQQQVKELIKERDLARSRLEEILQAAGIDQNLLPWTDSGHLRTSSWDGEYTSTSSHLRTTSLNRHSTSDASAMVVDDPSRSNASINTYSFPKNDEHYFSDNNISPSQFINQYFMPEQPKANSVVDGCKEVECIKKDPPVDIDDHEEQEQSPCSSAVEVECIKKDPTVDIDDHEEQDQSRRSSAVEVQCTEKDPTVDIAAKKCTVSYSRTQSLPRSTSCHAIIEKNVVVESETISQSKSDSEIKSLCRQDYVRSFEEKEMQQGEGDSLVYSPSRTFENLKGEYIDFMAKGIESGDGLDSDNEWDLLFEKQRRKIIELWDECNIPLLHRTYFFLLIKGDPSDSVYIEVELRRLSFLKETLDHAASARALNLERAMLSRKLLRKFTSKEREEMFEKWDIDLESRNRRVQLSQLLWTKTDDIQHTKDSAEIVAKLVGLIEPNKTPKELFGLSVAPKKESHNLWRDTISLLGY